MINYERVAEKLFSIVKGHGHTLVMFTDQGMETSDAAEARRFFVSKPNYMITLDPENRNVKFNKNSNVGLEDIESVMKQVKNLATANMLKSEVKVFGKEITPKDFAYQAKNYKDKNMNELSEASLSRMHGSIKTSYQTLESVRMVVRHRRAVDEEVRGSRSRQIQSIFLEQNGERLRFPHNHLAGARAMARHMYEGGDMQDSVGTYIIESVGNILKLNEFVRYARSNKLINENSEDVVKTVRENISAIRKELKGLTGATSYTTMKETIETRGLLAIEEDDTGDLKDMFTVRKFDEKIGDVLPLIKKLMDNKQNWRDAILEASQTEISISEKTNVSEDDVFEFENPVQKMGYKVKSLAERMIGQDDLSAFVGKAAGKIIEGNDLSKFEKTVVRNVLENAIIREAEECVCEACGELEEACKCSTKDVVDLISESFELKMKMLEHEDIFEADRTLANPYTPPGKIECSNCGDFASYLSDRHGNDLHYTCDTCGHEEDDQMVDFAFAGEIDEAEGDTCIRCRKGTMEVGDTMMGAQEKCNRCGYQHAVRESEMDEGMFDNIAKAAGRGLGKLAGKASVAIVDRAVGKMVADMKGGKSPVAFAAQYSGDQGVLDLIRNWLGRNTDNPDFKLVEKMYQMAGGSLDEIIGSELGEADYDDHHAGEIAAGAHSGMPSGMDIERPDCEDCDGTGIALDDVSDCYTCMGSGKVEDEHDEYDGQPSDYEEMQDFMGGDDWDHGQYDESIDEASLSNSDRIQRLLDKGIKVVSNIAGMVGQIIEVDDGLALIHHKASRRKGWGNVNKDTIILQPHRYDKNAFELVSTFSSSDSESEIKEIADPAAANECPECKGTGNAQDSIFDDDDCTECGGTGEVE